MDEAWASAPRFKSMDGVSGMADYGLAGDDLEQMYQEFILEASRDPHGKTRFAEDVSLESPANGEVSGESSVAQAHEACVVAQSHQFNPTCGDEVTVRVNLTDGTDGKEHRIESVVWDGHGCSISQASLSVMTDMVQGKSIDDFTTMSETFHELMNSRGKGIDDSEKDELLGDAMVFEGVSKYPMRIKCALLGWAAVKDSIAQALTKMPAAPAETVSTAEKNA